MLVRKAAPPAEKRSLAARLRRHILEQSFESHVGHIGSALSIADILAVLWGEFLHRPGSTDPQRDRFILAKGHAALALYAVMLESGLITAAQFHTYCKDDTLLGAHPEHGLPGVEVATGSLGQGLSVGCGIAYSLQQRGSKARVFVLVSDAECNEGQVWEAVMFAAHHRLTNLVVLVDQNDMQAMGETQDILSLHPLSARFEAFGWRAMEVDGHDEVDLRRAFQSCLTDGVGPTVILARTVLGKGVSFMENRLEWHYRNLTPALAHSALQELED
jgi:transketolase